MVGRLQSEKHFPYIVPRHNRLPDWSGPHFFCEMEKSRNRIQSKQIQEKPLIKLVYKLQQGLKPDTTGIKVKSPVGKIKILITKP